MSENGKRLYSPSHDRIYPRCPECRREQYGPAVLGFSRGEHGCHICGHVIREGARLSANAPIASDGEA